jgi:hypothetical protein
MSEPGVDAITSCARWAVVGHGAPDLDGLDDATWRRAMAGARLDRLVGVLAGVAADQGLEGQRREEIARLESEWALHTMRAERAMLAVAERFEQAGLPVRVLKGAVFAHGYWPAPELRVFADADILVRSADLDRAVELVLEDGGERPLPQVRRGFDRRFGKSVTMRNADGIEIDLHRTLVAGPHTFLVPESDLWGSAAEVRVAGRAVPCLPPDLQLVHAATHAVVSTAPRAASVLDVAFTGRVADLESAADIAERWKLRAVVREAGTRLGALLGADGGAVVGWAAALEPSDEEERLHELFTGRRSFRRSALAAAPYIDRRLDRTRFLVSLAFPSRAHRHAR